MSKSIFEFLSLSEITGSVYFHNPMVEKWNKITQEIQS